MILSPPLNFAVHNGYSQANSKMVSCGGPLSSEFNLGLEELHSEADSNTLLDNVIHIRSLYKSPWCINSSGTLCKINSRPGRDVIKPAEYIVPPATSAQTNLYHTQ